MLGRVDAKQPAIVLELCARDIGEALRETYGGALEFEYDQEEGLRVRWER